MAAIHQPLRAAGSRHRGTRDRRTARGRGTRGSRGVPIDGPLRGRHVRSFRARGRAVALEDVLVPPRDVRAAPPALVDALLVVGAALTVLSVLGTALLLATGGRWFSVETPSMGTAAPVGALVVTVPVGDRTVRAGDVVTFRPAGSVRTWTHRVVRTDQDGSIRTRGDVNAALDPWRTPVGSVVGRVVVVVPVLGRLVHELPLLLLGALAVRALTGTVHDRALRGAFRVLGDTVVLSAVIAVTRPLVDARLLSSVPADQGAVARVVSAGMLPTRVAAPGGESIHLTAGEVGRLLVETSTTGRLTLDSTVDLGAGGWALLVAVCCLPAVRCVALERSRPRLS